MKQLLTIILSATFLICNAQKKDTCNGLGSIGIQMNYPDAKLSPKAYAAYDTNIKVMCVLSDSIFLDKPYKRLSDSSKPYYRQSGFELLNEFKIK